MQYKFKTIPKAYQVESLVHQKSYLVDGELKIWRGQQTEVFSTISSTEVYKPTLLGTVPELGENEALEALQSAERAYNRGQGLWPTMRVESRIEAMEKFVSQMKTKKTNSC